MRKYGQKAINISKSITFPESCVKKIIIALLCGHLKRLQKYEF